jgi:hydroxymethylglutaryl-CoA lyase
MSKRLYIQEVATRDGFQIEANFAPTEAKIALIDRVSQTGLAKIEVTSFTSPKAIPNLRDAEDVMRGIRRAEGVEYTVLAPNVKGCERALACEADEINLVMSASDTHGLANLRMTPEQSLVQFREIIEVTRGSGVFINASLSTTFGCPFEGDVPERRIYELVQRLLEIGVQGITLCDTTGMADPAHLPRSAEQLAAGSIHRTLPQHARHGPGQRAGSAERRHRPLRRLARRTRRLPLRTRGQRQYLH